MNFEALTYTHTNTFTYILIVEHLEECRKIEEKDYPWTMSYLIFTYLSICPMYISYLLGKLYLSTCVCVCVFIKVKTIIFINFYLMQDPMPLFKCICIVTFSLQKIFQILVGLPNNRSTLSLFQEES